MDFFSKKALCRVCAFILLAGCASNSSFATSAQGSNDQAGDALAQANAARAQAEASLEAKIAKLDSPGYEAAAQAEAEALKVSNDPDGIIKSMVSFTDVDRLLVHSGRLPSDVLIYDAQLIKLVSVTPASIKEHRLHPEWMKKFHDLHVARDASIQGNRASVEAMEKQRQQSRQTQNDMTQLYEDQGNDLRKDAANRAAADRAYQEKLGNGPGSGLCQTPVFGGTGTQTTPCPDGN
ncbi:hypothetical protein [Rhodanobacter sp. L36]|uniref:hypothetical protein n=1 Tax=Rhodanobacter sp. L36 TaxID=1747221 RepID=UPI00131DE4AC|nr:hypothetical protein [Rhodanobacter sp. L36]